MSSDDKRAPATFQISLSALQVLLGKALAVALFGLLAGYFFWKDQQADFAAGLEEDPVPLWGGILIFFFLFAIGAVVYEVLGRVCAWAIDRMLGPGDDSAEETW